MKLTHLTHLTHLTYQTGEFRYTRDHKIEEWFAGFDGTPQMYGHLQWEGLREILQAEHRTWLNHMARERGVYRSRMSKAQAVEAILLHVRKVGL
jgi:hypothetical protein